MQNQSTKLVSKHADVIDGHFKKRSSSPKSPPPPPPQKSNETRITSINSITANEPESHVEANCTVNNKRRSGMFLLEFFLHFNNKIIGKSNWYIFQLGEITIDNRLHIHKNDVKRAKTNNYATVVRSNFYGDLTPIVTTVAPTKRPDETIGLNDLHPNEPNRSLLNDSLQQHQSKEEDRWDKFIECLLFFCCVA